ncbi:hypothetical protein [Arthrobacter sp. NPDC058127]
MLLNFDKELGNERFPAISQLLSGGLGSALSRLQERDRTRSWRDGRG